MIPSSSLQRSYRKKKTLNRVFFWTIVAIEIIVIAVLVLLAIKAFNLGKNDKTGIYGLLALGLIILWIGILVGYFAWAIYFYNINLGLTDSEWEDVRTRYGYIPEDADDVRTENPHAEETLGLPKGTIRGTIALSLLVAGLAMTIYSMSLEPELKANSFIVDHLDFLKTAFLMMIAFYFGNKALETIGYRSQRVIGSPNPNSSISNGGRSSLPPTSVPETPPATATTGSSPTKIKNLLNQGETSTDSETSTESEDPENDFYNPKAVQ